MSKILVIDDDLEILEVFEVLLNNKGLIVKTESNWEKTFNEIESFEPDLILMDIDLGNEDGRNITNRIKSSNSTSHIPVILISGIKEINKNLGDCFYDDFIAKPFEAEVLYEKIQYQLYKKSFEYNIEMDFLTRQRLVKDHSESISYLYDKYAAVLFAYILSIIKDKERSENFLIEIFTDLANSSEPVKRENLLLKCIRMINQKILKTTITERQSLLSLFNTTKQIKYV